MLLVFNYSEAQGFIEKSVYILQKAVGFSQIVINQLSCGCVQSEPVCLFRAETSRSSAGTIVRSPAAIFFPLINIKVQAKPER